MNPDSSSGTANNQGIDMFEWTCKYCNKTFIFEHYSMCGSHTINCKKNPNYKDIVKKRKNSNTLKRIKIIKICKKCGEEFKVERTINKKGEIKIYKSERQYCSRKCANSRIQTKKQNEARSRKLKKDKKEYIKICVYCNKEFKTLNKKVQVCSKSCKSKYIYMRRSKKKQLEINNKLSASTKLAYRNGKSVYGGKTKWYKYKEIKVQGTYELRTCYILDKMKELKQIKDWEYTTDRILYIDANKKQRNYLLDFKIFDNDNTFYYLEIKGFKKKNDELKWEAVKQKYTLKIWFLTEIEYYENLLEIKKLMYKDHEYLIPNTVKRYNDDGTTSLEYRLKLKEAMKKSHNKRKNNFMEELV